MSDEALPAPLTPPECDLRGMEWMPLYGHRLFGSDFDAHVSDAEFRAGLNLWWAAWNQIPAASLPDDDTALCRLAGLGRDLKSWGKVRARALHKFIKCADTRLYHRALAALASEAWERRLRDRQRKEKWRKGRGQNADGGGDMGGDRTYPDTSTERMTGKDRTGQDRTGQESKKEEGAPERAGNGGYAFEGDVIRLLPKDLDQWRKTYHAVPDIEAELRTADAYYAQTPPKDGKWFFAASAWLKREHDRRLTERAASKPSSFNF